MVSKDFEALSGLDRFSSGYIIIGGTLFSIKNRFVEDSWELASKNIPDKVAEARTVAELSNRRRIVVDDVDYFSEDIVSGEGELITAEEAFRKMSPEDQDDYESLAEYFSK